MKLTIATATALLLAGWSFRMPPDYVWNKPGGDTRALSADQQACIKVIDERYPLGFGAAGSAFRADPVRRADFKDCMEARGWTKDPN